MNDYGYITAQRQYDNQVPPNYDEEPVTSCGICGGEIYEGQEYYKGHCNICCDCYESLEKSVAENEEPY